MYVSPNYLTKRALRDAVSHHCIVGVFQAGIGHTPSNGDVSVEGPHYPAAHSWYARVRVKDGRVIKVLA